MRIFKERIGKRLLENFIITVLKKKKPGFLLWVVTKQITFAEGGGFAI